MEPAQSAQARPKLTTAAAHAAATPSPQGRKTASHQLLKHTLAEVHQHRLQHRASSWVCTPVLPLSLLLLLLLRRQLVRAAVAAAATQQPCCRTPARSSRWEGPQQGRQAQRLLLPPLHLLLLLLPLLLRTALHLQL
jgi:hypothetical protein